MALSGIVPSPARADAKAEALLAKVKAAYKSAASYSTTATVTMSQGVQKFVQTSTVQLRKPNLARILTTSPQKMSVMSDGKNIYMLMADHQYMKQPATAGGEQIGQLVGLPGAFFFGQDSFGFGKLSDASTTKTYAGKEKVGGVEYDVVNVTASKPVAVKLKIFVASNGMVGRSAANITFQNNTVTQVSEWKAQKLNSVPASMSFAVALPRDAKPFKAPAEADYAAKLVAVGKQAPVFAMPTPTGGSISLSDALADHKAVLVNFWFYG
jgi:outer membrane lipoprotein-sorting protein